MQRILMASALSALLIWPAVAQNRPRHLGDFGSWIAAVQGERGEKLCYAYTNVTRMSHSRSDVVLMVSRGSRLADEVSLAAGYPYPRRARVTLRVGRTTLPLRPEGRVAHASLSPSHLDAFRGGSEAVAQGPREGGRPGLVTDHFSLRGFTGAYNAIRQECPPPARRRR